VQVRDPQARRSLADDSDFIATAGDLDSGVVERTAAAPSRKEAAAARTSARVIKAARALSAASSAPAAPTPTDSSSTPISSSSAKEGERHDHAPPASAHSVRVLHPRRLVNFFPESALEPEKPSTPALAAAAESPTLLRSEPAAMVSDASQPAAQSDAASSAVGAAPAASSIDSTSHLREPFELARSELLAAIRAGGGPALLTGPAGVGKTTLCRALVQELDRRTVASVVSGAPQSFDDLLKMMLVDFGVMTTESSAAAHAAQSMLMSTLDCFLESLIVLGATAVVFIDDAQKIPAGVLAELAAMRAPGTPSARVLQLVLVGRPSLRSLLKRADVKSLDASIVRRMNLVPVRVHESAGDAARPAAAINNAPTEPAAVDLSLGRPRTPSPAFKRLLLIAAVALIVLAGALWVWRDAVSRTILQ
jgi:hypothetical protein